MKARLFVVRPDELDARELTACATLLSDDERARGERYRFERDRRTHLVAHALKRAALSACSGQPHSAFTFRVGPHGKPAILQPRSELCFNLSHTHGLVACLVAESAEVGVDVEDGTRRVASLELAERFFAAAEVADLRDTPETERGGRFFSYWTLKEAYVKALGAGLSLPLDRFWFTLRDDAAPTVHFDSPELDASERWRFFRWQLAPSFYLAGAVEATGGEPVITLEHGMPADLG